MKSLVESIIRRRRPRRLVKGGTDIAQSVLQCRTLKDFQSWCESFSEAVTAQGYKQVRSSKKYGIAICVRHSDKLYDVYAIDHESGDSFCITWHNAKNKVFCYRCGDRLLSMNFMHANNNPNQTWTEYECSQDPFFNSFYEVAQGLWKQ